MVGILRKATQTITLNTEDLEKERRLLVELEVEVAPPLQASGAGECLPLAVQIDIAAVGDLDLDPGCPAAATVGL